MKIIGQMVVRNEHDIIAECVHEALRWIDTLVVLDGQSTDGTHSLLHALAAKYITKDKELFIRSQPDPDEKFDNGLRVTLQELTRPFLEPGDWILSIDADEIPDECADPRSAIIRADRAGANVVRSFVPQFWLTFDDIRRGALNEDETVSIQERRRWYSWGHMGTFAWKYHPDHYYPTDVSKRTPDLPGLNWKQWQRPGPVVSVCKHYCIRTVAQGLARARARLERGGRWQFGKYATTWIMDEQLAGLHYLDPENEVWNTGENHDRLYEYMGGKLTGDRKATA